MSSTMYDFWAQNPGAGQAFDQLRASKRQRRRDYFRHLSAPSRDAEQQRYDRQKNDRDFGFDVLTTAQKNDQVYAQLSSSEAVALMREEGEKMRALLQADIAAMEEMGRNSRTTAQTRTQRYKVDQDNALAAYERGMTIGPGAAASLTAVENDIQRLENEFLARRMQDNLAKAEEDVKATADVDFMPPEDLQKLIRSRAEEMSTADLAREKARGAESPLVQAQRATAVQAADALLQSGEAPDVVFGMTQLSSVSGLPLEELLSVEEMTDPATGQRIPSELELYQDVVATHQASQADLKDGFTRARGQHYQELEAARKAEASAGASAAGVMGGRAQLEAYQPSVETQRIIADGEAAGQRLALPPEQRAQERARQQSVQPSADTAGGSAPAPGATSPPAAPQDTPAGTDAISLANYQQQQVEQQAAAPQQPMLMGVPVDRVPADPQEKTELMFQLLEKYPNEPEVRATQAVLLASANEPGGLLNNFAKARGYETTDPRWLMREMNRERRVMRREARQKNREQRNRNIELGLSPERMLGGPEGPTPYEAVPGAPTPPTRPPSAPQSASRPAPQPAQETTAPEPSERSGGVRDLFRRKRKTDPVANAGK